MWRHAMIAVKLTLVTMLLLGVLYPLTVTGLAQVLFPRQANGSLIREHGQVIGSALIGQSFTRPEYFHPRPSAAGAGYDATASGGSNLGPTSRALLTRVRGEVGRLAREDPGLPADRVPVDMVTTSASGLDPDISLANAAAQVARVARARGWREEEVRRVLRANTTPRQFGLLGEPRVNVLRVNRALDARETARR
jgi:potassium-transporting ATPase KdpC subunit